MNDLKNKIKIYSKSILRIRKSDVWLVSYPRSGNSWVRIVLDIFFRDQSAELTADLKLLDQRMPVLGHTDLSSEISNVHPVRVIKSHLRYNRILFRSKPYRILLVRNPFDAMHSYYRLRSAHRTRKFEGTFHDFVKDKKYGIRGYMEHIDSWLPHSGTLHFYEDMRKNPASEFEMLLNPIPELTVDPTHLAQSIKAASIDNVKKTEKKTGVRDASRFSNDFKVTGGSESFSVEKLIDSEIEEFTLNEIRKYRSSQLIIDRYFS